MFHLQENDVLLDQYTYTLSQPVVLPGNSLKEVARQLRQAIQGERLEWSMPETNRLISVKNEDVFCVHREITLNPRHISQQYLTVYERAKSVRMVMLFDQPRIHKTFEMRCAETGLWEVEVITYIEKTYHEKLGEYLDIMRQSHRQVDELFFHWFRTHIALQA